MPNLIVMPKTFAFVSQAVNDADRFLIRSHVMRGKNSRVGSRRSMREAARQADKSLAPLTTDCGPRGAPRKCTETAPGSVDTKPGARRQDTLGERENNERRGKAFETACLQLDRQIRTRSGVFASLDNTETSCGELISECT